MLFRSSLSLSLSSLSLSLSPPSTKIIYRQELIGRLASLPEEILIQIFDFLDVRTLGSLSLVCSTIRAIAEGFPWRKVYIQRYQLLENILTDDMDSPRRWKFKVCIVLWCVVGVVLWCCVVVGLLGVVLVLVWCCSGIGAVLSWCWCVVVWCCGA